MPSYTLPASTKQAARLAPPVWPRVEAPFGHGMRCDAAGVATSPPEQYESTGQGSTFLVAAFQRAPAATKHVVDPVAPLVEVPSAHAVQRELPTARAAVE